MSRPTLSCDKSNKRVLSILKQCDPETTAFFPGCSLRQLAPDLTGVVYHWLADRGYCLYRYKGCCGLPAYFSGDPVRYDQINTAFLRYLNKKNIKTLIAACPNCYYALKDSMSKFNVDLAVHPLPVVFVEEGCAISNETFDQDAVFTIHDSCPDQDEQIFASALRALTSPLGIVEMVPSDDYTSCCGAGQEFADLCFEEQMVQAEKRLACAAAVQADIVIASCASCTYALSAADSSQSTCHYLELLFRVWFSQ